MGYHLRENYLFFGWLAVDLFFVLSGYLITAIILRNYHQPHFLRNFYARRSLRIWPIYYLVLLVALGLYSLLGIDAPAGVMLQYFTYTQNLQSYWRQDAFNMSDLQHTWTLAIEEQFYLFWPLLLWLMKGRRVIALACGFAALSVWARASGFSNWILLGRCDGFAVGGLLAALLAARGPTRQDDRRLQAAFLATGAVGAGVLVAGLAWSGLEFFHPTGRQSAVTILAANALFFGMVGLLIAHTGSPVLAPLRDRRLCYLGEISYGMYLYHGIILTMTTRVVERYHLPRPWWVDVAELLSFLAIPALSWRYIERPILALKGRFDYPEKAARARPSPGPGPIGPGHERGPLELALRGGPSAPA